jgi:RHS repeat-associated protein
MFMIRTYTFNLTIIGILFVFMLPLTGLAERPANIYSSPNAEGQIGISEKAPLDNPFDNIFHVDITDELCGNETVWLTYELEGVADHSAISRSINDQIAFGGYLIKKHEGWTAQREQINVNWLREGDNVIRFSVPGEAEHSYKVRNLSIEIGASEEALMEGVVFNQPTLNYFGDKAYVKGYLQGQSGTLQIDGKKVKTFNGEFELIIKKPLDSKEETWTAQAEVAYADGTSVCETIVFSNSVHADYAYALETGSFKTERLFKTKTAQYLSLAGASIDVSAEALNTPVFLSITTLRDVDVPALDAGMVNVTAKHSGYRYLPHGTAFQEAAKLILPYDADKIPSGYTEKDIKTYFFDEQSHHWVPLPLDSVVVGNGEVWSRTMHFTDMINGIIQVPESPEVNAYNSTSMKGIKAANPTAAINLMQPPSANSMGGANMGYPLNLPAGRNGIQPQLSLSYNNGGGNSWMGLGWNLTIPSITIDTRWGVPRYDPDDETETYTLNGQQLSPVAHRGDLGPRTGEKIFHPRVEGSFQRIVRHGSTPSTYWWEVTDKSGVIYIYGKDDEAVLTDGSGNRANWCLQEVRDLNQNFVKYHYTKQEDTGLANGSVPGQEIYVSKITYTGHGSTEGKYSVDFIRDRDLGETKRLDVSIDARLGFKRVTADLLRKVEVKFNNNIIRHYEFGYEPGAFFKTLLTDISEFDAAGNLFTTHDLEYYDDVKALGGYEPFKVQESWNPQDDQLKTGLVTSVAGFSKDYSVLSGNKSVSGGGGLTVAIGLNDGNYTSKSNTIGGSFAISKSSTEGKIMLIDMNGDGLPDKLFLDSDQAFYRPNISELTGEQAFGNKIAINNLGNFYKEKSSSTDGGFEANAGFGPVSAFIGYSNTTTKTETSTYLTDVNGDGLTDVVKNGNVFFNVLDPETGIISFTPESGATLNPITASDGPDTSILNPTQEEIDALIDQYPLHDVVRMWRAPFNGRISIDAPVSLTSPLASNADGVRVSIQHKATELWSKVIDAGITADQIPSGVDDINIQKGDQLYFRVQSRENGEDDQVTWQPVIEYLDKDSNAVNANGKPLYKFSVEEDFILTMPLEVLAPIDGVVNITGNFYKPLTTDDVHVLITRTTESGTVISEFDQSYTWDEEQQVIIDFDQTVNVNDVFKFSITSSTNIDWPALTWRPRLYYKSSNDPAVPEVIIGQDTLLLYYPAVDYGLYSNNIIHSQTLVIEEDVDSVSILPRIAFNPNGLAANYRSFTFSVKKRDTLVYKETLVAPALGGTVESDTVKLSVAKGDSLFLEYHIAIEDLALATSSNEVFIQLPDTSYLVGASIFTRYTKEKDFIYGPLYRNWGQFGYNGNRDRANQPINEGELKLNEALHQEINGSDISSPEELENQDPYNPATDNFIMLYADFKRRVWAGFDDLTYINENVISSSRLGEDDISLNNPMGSGSAGFFAINKTNKSKNNSIAGGAGGGFVSGSATTSFGSSEQFTDYMDLNGDRYPDIFTKHGVIFTTPTGGLSADFNNSFHNGVLTEGKTNGFGASVNGTFKINPKSGSTGGEQDESDASDAKANGSLSANGGSGTNTSQYSWTDINGDGLPDRINSNGKVSLNLGYSLAAEEPWGYSTIQVSKSENFGAGLGVSIGSGSESSSIAAGIGLALSDNTTNRSLQDVNGDGLVDDLMLDGGVKVKLNTGNGFDLNYIDWTGASEINASSSTSESINASFTGCIPLPPVIPVVKLCFNPSGHGGQSVSRDEQRISDIDGDGYPDYLSSDKDSQLKVKRSTINRTNMLKQVNRPLGASFTLDYKPNGSTYDNPNTIWTLVEVEVVDGFEGDGVDTMRSVFTYENGFYERHEREFYGFKKVTTQTLDAENGDTPYTITIQTFENDNYYEKGLLLGEVMTDNNGNKFMEKEHTYVLKNITDGADLPDSFKDNDKDVGFPAQTVTNLKFYEGQIEAGKSTSTTYEYDRLGNVIEYTDFGDVGEGDDLIANITYHDYPGPYIKDAPKSIIVNGTDRIYRKREADIDANTGNVTQIRQFLEDETKAVSDMEYDAFGNLKKIIKPSNHKNERLNIDYEYDTEVGIYVTKVNNGYGYSSEETYDFRFGKTLESIDLNGNKITYELDDLGRITKITGPYEQQGKGPFTIGFEYYPEAIVPWALTQHYDPQNKNNFIETAIFIDGLGKVLQTKKDAAIYQGEGKPDKEMMIVSGRVIFDGFSRTVKSFYPVFEDVGRTGDFNFSFDTIDPTIKTYDVLNRELSVTLPDASVSITGYDFGNDREDQQQFRTRNTDANGVISEQFIDVRGRVTAAKNITSDGDVWTNFEYNAINEQVIATDDLGHSILSEFDWFGRRTKRMHPDGGNSNYTYDLANNLTELVTANLSESGGAISYTYEKERLIEITYPDNPENNVHYVYGESGAPDNRAGRIVIQEDATGAQEFFYGSLGEVVKNIRTVVIPKFDDQTFITEWKYDAWNRLESMIYADGEEVSYHYNEGGLLNSMDGKKKGASYNYVQQLGYDKFEQRVYLEYGNGTKTNYNYEPDRRRLKSMTAATASNRNFMDNAYGYDLVDNILSLKNNASVPTSNLMGGSSDYSYEYDDLYRLVKAEGKYMGTGDYENHAYSMEMSYNTVGGITRKNQLHTSKGHEQKKTTYDMAYTYNDEQPHAPIHIGKQAYSYDANGNQTGWTHDVSGQRRNIIWDEENRIRAISDNGANYHYTYDASGTRVLKGKSNGQSVYVNGEWKTGSGNMGNYTVYVNPYIVLKSGGYTKHYYIEGQRIVSKLGGGLDNKGKGPLKAGEGKVNYNKKHDELFEGIVRNLKFLAEDGTTILTAGKSGKIPPGQVIGNSPGKGGTESFQYFYHPDHLGSTSYITDASGEVYQHLEYFAFGETFVEEHSNTHRTPYLFNGKELDEETGLYYYGARYYEPNLSIFLSIDPAALKMPGWSPYSYAFNNPVKLTDPDGRLPIIPLIIKAGAGGAADMMAQAAMNYYFNPETTGDIGASFDAVNWLQVGRSAAEGLIPWKTPGGKLGRAAATALGDVVVNAASSGGDYSAEQAMQDFAVGFIGDLAGGGVGELLSKYGSKAVAQGLKRMGFDDKQIESIFTGAGTTWDGPVEYSSVPNSRNTGPGRSFSQSHKGKLRDANMDANNGYLRSDQDGSFLDMPTQSKKGVPANMNQAEVDHIVPKAGQGSNSSSNAQILSKEQNLLKSDN